MITFLIIYIYIYTLVAALAPQILPSIDNILSQFKIGDRVFTIPDSLPGVDRRQAEAFYGSVFEVVKFDFTWHYNIQSIHSLRNFTPLFQCLNVLEIAINF